jgi:CrcB protein
LVVRVHGTGDRIPIEPADQSIEAIAIEEAELRHAPGDRPGGPGFRLPEAVGAMVAISLGAILGANARFVVGRETAERFHHLFPLGTFLINCSGSFILGFYLTLVSDRPGARPATRLFIATGFLGAFTTFSTYSDESANLLRADEYLTAFAYAAGSLLLGLLAVWLGSIVAHRAISGRFEHP